jgi:hypothetical protein
MGGCLSVPSATSGVDEGGVPQTSLSSPELHALYEASERNLRMEHSAQVKSERDDAETRDAALRDEIRVALSDLAKAEKRVETANVDAARARAEADMMITSTTTRMSLAVDAQNSAVADANARVEREIRRADAATEAAADLLRAAETRTAAAEAARLVAVARAARAEADAIATTEKAEAERGALVESAKAGEAAAAVASRTRESAWHRVATIEAALVATRTRGADLESAGARALLATQAAEAAAATSARRAARIAAIAFRGGAALGSEDVTLLLSEVAELRSRVAAAGVSPPGNRVRVAAAAAFGLPSFHQNHIYTTSSTGSVTSSGARSVSPRSRELSSWRHHNNNNNNNNNGKDTGAIMYAQPPPDTRSPLALTVRMPSPTRSPAASAQPPNFSSSTATMLLRDHHRDRSPSPRPPSTASPATDDAAATELEELRNAVERAREEAETADLHAGAARWSAATADKRVDAARAAAAEQAAETVRAAQMECAQTVAQERDTCAKRLGLAATIAEAKLTLADTRTMEVEAELSLAQTKVHELEESLDETMIELEESEVRGAALVVAHESVSLKVGQLTAQVAELEDTLDLTATELEVCEARCVDVQAAAATSVAKGEARCVDVFIRAEARCVEVAAAAAANVARAEARVVEASERAGVEIAAAVTAVARAEARYAEATERVDAEMLTSIAAIARAKMAESSAATANACAAASDAHAKEADIKTLVANERLAVAEAQILFNNALRAQAERRFLVAENIIEPLRKQRDQATTERDAALAAYQELNKTITMSNNSRDNSNVKSKRKK